MLTAYNYYEPEQEILVQKGMKENGFFDRELEIAKKFAKSHPDSFAIKKSCVVCGSDKIIKFYEKWEVPYFRCTSCYSIMAGIKEEVEAEYIGLEELKNLRLSVAYQEDGSKNRQQRWEEFLSWLKYRTFRYCGKNTGFSVIDYGTKWRGLEKILRESELCETYKLQDSILAVREKNVLDSEEKVDIVLALDYIHQLLKPVHFFRKVHSDLKGGGLFILGTKVGSGFDILSLRENNRNVFPYEHILMPSKEGIEILLEQTGFELLEFTTPGTFDLSFVKSNINGLAENDYFMRYFLNTATPSAEADFQRFIQKSGLSSYAQIIARRVD